MGSYLFKLNVLVMCACVNMYSCIPSVGVWLLLSQLAIYPDFCDFLIKFVMETIAR